MIGEVFENDMTRDAFLKKVDFDFDRYKLQVKIIDYGLARQVEENDLLHSNVGTFLNRAPETL